MCVSTRDQSLILFRGSLFSTKFIAFKQQKIHIPPQLEQTSASTQQLPYSRKFSRYVYFVVESLIRIFVDKILQMAYNEASFQLKMMLSSEFPRTKFSLLIDYLRKRQNFHTAKISSYTV